ncbi:MAG: hypothetical protein ACR2PT_18710 [Endozoicomonas sp.]
MQPVNTSSPMVFQRKDDWRHKFQRSKKSGRMMWMGLPLEKQSSPMLSSAAAILEKLKPILLERFASLLQQELNFLFHEAFNIES